MQTPDKRIHTFVLNPVDAIDLFAAFSTMADDTAQDSQSKSGRLVDKRKKRRPKKKKLKDTPGAAVPYLPPPAVSSPSMTVSPPPKMILEQTIPTSPRRQTLMRHKKSDTSIGEPLFMSEVKEMKKNRRNVVGQVEPDESKLPLELSHQDPEDKATLFKCPAARVVVFHEQLGDATGSSGTLLGHGEFEIFQLHNGGVTYLACGRSFVYPLLPKLKMLRIDKNHFILPLVNPPRYWKIHIDSDDSFVLDSLEVVLKKIVKYTNLLVPEYTGVQTPSKNQFTPFFHDIPELPPSAPVSPNNLNMFNQDSFVLLPVRNLDMELHEKSNFATTSAIPSLQVSGSLQRRKPELARQGLHHPRPTTHANPYRKNALPLSDHVSDLSSMDSLLDEYEENISTTKSINYSMPRLQSHAVSIASSAHPPAIQYQRGKIALFPDRMSNIGSRDGTVDENMEEEDDFPTTSLSQYNRTRQNTRSVRSRRSSQSELYTSVSNWMEPGVAAPKLVHSRSTHSMASRTSAVHQPTLNDTYREIYRSITLHNLSLIAAGREQKNDKVLSKPAPGRKPASPYYSKLLTSDQVKRKNNEREVRKAPNQQDGLNSNDVYRLISSREPRAAKQVGIGRFFGW